MQNIESMNVKTVSTPAGTPTGTQAVKQNTPHGQYYGNYYGGGAGLYGATTYGHYTPRPTVPVPEDTKDVTKLSIVLMRQSVLNAISAICQPVAGASEFQVHYRALVVRVKNDQNEFIINIPTVFYNFKQSVAHSSVDYHLDDIDNEALAVKGISDKVIQDIFKEMPLLGSLGAIYDGAANVTFSEVNSGSIHRHPGRFGFSGTDYTKTPSNPGVIYREADATDKVHTDSVIYLGARTEIYTTETRILNIKPVDNGVEGTYCQIPTTTYVLNDIATGTSDTTDTSMQEFLGGLESVLKDPSGDYYITNAMGAVNGYAMVTEVINAFKEAKFEQDISHVLASHITSRGFTYGYQGATKKYSPVSTRASLDYWDDVWGMGDYEDDAYYNEKYGTSLGTQTKDNKAVNTAVVGTGNKEPLKLPSKIKNPYPVGSVYYLDWETRNQHVTK